MTKKVLLLGKDGQLGKEFVRFFKTNSSFDIDAFGHKELNITDRKKLFTIAKNNSYAIIINCSAYNNVDLAETERKTAFAVNYVGVRNLTEIAQINKSKLIHFSTDYIFNGEKKSPYFVYDQPNPLSVYGTSKLYGEEVIREIYDNYLIIRVSWVFGQGPNFITKLLDWSKKKDKLKIIQDQISSPTYTFDLVRATFKLLQEDITGTFQITNTPTSKIEWAKYILKQTGWEGKIIGVDMGSISFKAPRPKYAVLDNSLFNHVVDWEMPEWKDATNKFLKK